MGGRRDGSAPPGRRRPVLLLLLLLCLLLPAAVAHADAEEGVPPRPAAAPNLPAPPPLYEQYPVWSYTWDALSSDSASHQTLIWVNTVLTLKAWVLKVAIRALEYALHLDVGGQVLAPAGSAMQNLRAALWDSGGGALVTAALALAGGYALLLWSLRGAGSRAWTALGSAGAVLLLALALFSAGPDWLQTTAGLGRALGSGALRAVAGATVPGGDATGDGLVQQAAAQAWDTYVYQPWLTGEFGSLDNARRFADAQGTPGGRMLQQLPSGRINSYLAIEPNNRSVFLPWWNEDYLVRRMGIALTSTLTGALFAGVLLLLAGAVLAYQLVLTVLLATAPLWLLASLWYPGGLSLTRRAVEHGLGALVQLVLLPALLAVFLVLTMALGAADGVLGWAGLGLLQAVLAAVVWRYRRLPALAVARAAVAIRPAAGGTATPETARQAPAAAASRQAAAAPAPLLAALPVQVLDEARLRVAAEVPAAPMEQEALRPGRSPGPEAAPGPQPVLLPAALHREIALLEQRFERVRTGGADPAVVVVRAPASAPADVPAEAVRRPGQRATELPALPLDQQRRALRLPQAPSGG